MHWLYFSTEFENCYTNEKRHKRPKRGQRPNPQSLRKTNSTSTCDAYANKALQSQSDFSVGGVASAADYKNIVRNKNRESRDSSTNTGNESQKLKDTDTPKF
ncbi:hypothetical protein FE848_18560 [Marinobacter sp. 1-3A]|uniref:hypothetical protein n=1 Tax=Marinobacter sp. 1-3A TaxID=2582920 RepID=UPI001904FCB7|nr:hypothetical protein [Marinobacter sp. 1-3A]MBK1875218.1 hypothetical protein [Marinobacter sp. 1-3A]